MDNKVVIERLEHIARHQAVIHALVFVLKQLGQLVLPNVNHGVGGQTKGARARGDS